MFSLLISSLASIVLILAIGKILGSQNLKLRDLLIQNAKKQAAELEQDSQSRVQEIQNSFEQEKQEVSDSINLLEESVQALQARHNSRKQRLDAYQKNLNQKQEETTALTQSAKAKTQEIIQLLEEKISKSQEQVKETIKNKYALQTKDILNHNLTHYIERSKKLSGRISHDILKSSMQRITTESSVDKTSRILKMPSSNSFKKILKDPKAIEIIAETLGVEIEPIESDHSFRVSSFIMWNSEIAKKVLSKMALSFKFDPSKLEGLIQSSKDEFFKHLVAIGKKALKKIGLTDQHDKVCEIVGKLNYRTSFGQNILKHSFETGYLCSLIASQVGANPKIAMLGGFFHDIGKALDQEVEGSHDILGMEFLKEHGFPFEIYHPAHSHHYAVPIETLEAEIVVVGDKLSASRQGARTESLEMYIQRVQGLERIAYENKHIQRAFAVSAGREVRAYLNTKNSTDKDMAPVASELVTKIQDELIYPGKIKVNIIREFITNAVASKK